mgnify:CR=1 FL=1
MKKLIFIVGFLVFCILKLDVIASADIEIKEKYIGNLYNWYINEYTAQKAFFYYSMLRMGYDVEIKGVKISSKGKGDININLKELNPLEIWQFRWGDYQKIMVGRLESGFYESTLSDYIYRLVQDKAIEIIPNNWKSKGIVKIKIIP